MKREHIAMGLTAFVILFAVFCIVSMKNRQEPEPEPETAETFFKANESVEDLTQGRYLKVQRGNPQVDVLIEYDGEGIAFDRGDEILTIGNIRACYYGTQYYGATTPTDFYVIDVSDMGEDILTIKNAHSVDICDDYDTAVYALDYETYEYGIITYDAGENKLYVSY